MYLPVRMSCEAFPTTQGPTGVPDPFMLVFAVLVVVEDLLEIASALVTVCLI